MHTSQPTSPNRATPVTLALLGALNRAAAAARAWRPGRGRKRLQPPTYRLIDPKPGQVFTFPGRPDEAFVRHPVSGSIMRVSTFVAREGGSKRAQKVLAQAERVERQGGRQQRRAALRLEREQAVRREQALAREARARARAAATP